jgi:hypothetical protein
VQCNIDSRGRVVRLVSGLLWLGVAVLLLLLAGVRVLQGAWPWALAPAAAVLGAFQVYEGWCGWCALRALGIRTRI